MRSSSSLAIGERSEIGRYEVPSLAGLPGFRMGMILPIFYVAGMDRLDIERFSMFVMWRIAFEPRCLSMIDAMLSGPIALEGFVCFSASVTWFSI